MVPTQLKKIFKDRLTTYFARIQLCHHLSMIFGSQADSVQLVIVRQIKSIGGTENNICTP